MKQIIKPNKLIDGIAVFSASEPLYESRNQRVETQANKLIGLGYNIEYGSNIKSSFYYAANTALERADEFNTLAAMKNIQLLISSWGGKSSSSILEYLDYAEIAKERKLISTFSDTTLIANAIFQKTGLITFVGPNVFGKLDESEHSHLNFFKNSNAETEIFNDDKLQILRSGTVKGRIVGGNLSTFTLGLTGTQYFPSIENAIFLWESGSPTPQILDQYLTLLRNTGFLSTLSGMVIGGLENCKDKKEWGNRNPIDIIMEKTIDYNYPIIITEKFGHGKRENPIFPIGALCELSTYSKSLTIVESIIN